MACKKKKTRPRYKQISCESVLFVKIRYYIIFIYEYFTIKKFNKKIINEYDTFVYLRIE